jgi:O-antigen/teichoic acid export membrane protein
MIRRALQNTGWLLGARGVNAALSLAYLAIATRALGLEGFGIFSLAVTFARAATGFASFQSWQAVVRWGQEEHDISDAIGYAVALDLIAVVAGIAIAAPLMFLAGDWLPVPDKNRLETFLLTGAFLIAARGTPTGILRLHNRYAQAAAADSVTSIVRVVGAGLAAIFSPKPSVFLGVWAAAEILTTIAYWVLALRLEKVDLSKVSLARLPRPEKGAWAFVWGTGLSAMLAQGGRQIMLLVIGSFGGPAPAAIYRIATQLGEGLLKLAQALLRAVYPELVRDPMAARHIAIRIGWIAVYTGLAATLLSFVAGHWLITVIAGHDYQAAYIPMIILSAAAAVELAGATLEALLVSRGHALRNLMLRAWPTAAALVALPFTVPQFGVNGASMVVLASSVLTVAGLIYANRKE